MQHIIKKQVIDLILDKHQDAFRVQHLMSQHYWKEIVLMLEKAFDTASTEEEIIQLEKLEIDLGIVSVKDIERESLGEVILKKISEQLIAVKRDISSRAKVKIQSKPLSISGQWMFYMQHGYLPWNVVQANSTWYNNVLEAFAGDSIAIGKLRYLVQKDQHAARRIIFQHDHKFITSLVETLTAENQKALPEAVDEIAEVAGFLNQRDKGGFIFQKKQLKQKIWLEILRLAAPDQKNLTAAKITLHILQRQLGQLKLIPKLPQRYFSKNRIVAEVLRQLKVQVAGKEKSEQSIVAPQGNDAGIHKQPAGSDNITGNAEKINEGGVPEETIKSKPSAEVVHLPGEIEARRIPDEEIKSPIADDGKPGLGIGDSLKSDAEIIRSLAEDLTKDKPVVDKTVTPRGSDGTIEIDEEGIFIQHAGVVLLHPFLSMFFKNLGLVKEREFIDIVSHQKALYLVHYLATGSTGPAEHELVIAKVLCAWPLRDPVDSAIVLKADELDEADGLLIAAIQRWEKLKSTTPGALRATFLQRNGKLYYKNDSLRLQVESAGAIDILLDHLPWNLSLLKLPWMKDILRVDWR